MDPDNVPAPAVPTGLRVVRMHGRSLRLIWNENTEKSLSGYRVYHSTDDVTYTLLKEQAVIQYVHRKLDPATQYYKVSAVMNGKESALSSAVSAVVASPSVPTGLAIERLANSAIRLSWLEATPSTREEGFEGYEVYHSTDDVTYTLLETVTDQSYTDHNLSAATHYYKVLTKANGAESALSSAVSAVIAVPVTPTGLRVNRMHGQALRVSWNQSAPSTKEEGFEGYNLYHSTDDVSYALLLTTKGEFYMHSNLDPATHYYKVSHLANGAESALSSAVSAVISDPIPYVKTDTVATAGSPVTLDIETTLGRKGTNGTIICLGSGVLEVEFSYDGGTSWTDVMELRPEDYFDLSDLSGHLEISDIRLDTDISGTSYTLTLV